MEITTHIGIYITQRTWRDCVWALLGMLILHPVCATKSMWNCVGSTAKNVHFIKLERY